MASDFQIHVLGCGSAKPTLRHQPSSTVINFRGNLFMIDCGEGTQTALQRFHLKLPRLNHIFLTHLHGDHVLGLPGLISSMGLSGGGGELTIHTFPEGEKILRTIFDFFSHDLPINVNFHIIHPEEAIVFENKALRVRTVPLRHSLPAVGYIFEEKPRLRHIIRAACDFHHIPVSKLNAIKNGEDFVKPDGTVISNELLTTPADPSRSYAHISDTSFFPEIAPKIGPVDLLFHETTYLDQNINDAHARGHSTAKEAAQIAKLCGAQKLLTGHYSSRYKDDKAFLEEALQEFPNVILNREGLTINL